MKMRMLDKLGLVFSAFSARGFRLRLLTALDWSFGSAPWREQTGSQNQRLNLMIYDAEK
jgi:hypothetical protein